MGALRRVARVGDPAPIITLDGSVRRYGLLSGLLYSGENVLFQSFYSSDNLPGVVSGIFLGPPDKPDSNVVLFPGAVTANEVFADLGDSGWDANADGVLAFTGNISNRDTGEPVGRGLWRKGFHGNLELLVRSGQQAPGFAGGKIIRDIGWCKVGPAGEVYFSGNVTGDDTDDGLGSWAGYGRSFNPSCIWRSQNGTNQLMVAFNAPIDGLPDSIRLSGMYLSGLSGHYHINTNGTMCLPVLLKGPGTETNGSALVQFREGTLHLVLRPGDVLPGLAPARVTGSSWYQTDDDQITLTVGTNTPDDLPDAPPTKWAVYLWNGSGFELLLHTGTLVGVSRPGATFKSFLAPARNLATGAIIYLADIGAGDTNRSGIWVRRADGTIQTIAVADDVITVEGVGQRTISDVEVIGDAGVQEDGSVVFFAKFAEGDGGVLLARPVSAVSMTMPRLTVSGGTNGHISLSWSAMDNGWHLESSTDPQTGTWQPIYSVATTAGNHDADLASPSQSIFFRLSR